MEAGAEEPAAKRVRTGTCVWYHTLFIWPCVIFPTSSNVPKAEQSDAQCLSAEAADADDPAAAAPGARARAAALLAMQRSKAAAAAQPDSAPSPAPDQTRDAANGATTAGTAHTGAPPAATDASALGGSDSENGANEDDGWGEDVGYGDEPGFPLDQAAIDADVGQDLDHLVPAAQRLWEATSTGEALPPGWAKCPNAGSEVWGLTPIKVRALSLALATFRNIFSSNTMWWA